MRFNEFHLFAKTFVCCEPQKAHSQLQRRYLGVKRLKSAFNRHVKLVKLLIECREEDWDANLDDDLTWKTTLLLFKQKWQRSQSKLHLSTILKDSK